ncbi:MAG TPA: cytochrome C oxidase subunit IV family protein [Candidatus Limnocylindrales bacterium]|jgi:caa(3)-type oxidase subunit IV|nr:cytochrome C oxidase subunit IV family protein [Candidatus Limnocylindrales bacterium]
MSSTAHSHHNYIKIFIILSVLTAVEIGITFLGLPRKLLVSLLVGLAVWKAALVALHFMHLKLEKKTLTIIAIVPFVLCVFLSLMLLPDIFPR